MTIAHVYNRWTKNELHCFIDGQLVSQMEMAWFIGVGEVRTDNICEITTFIILIINDI